MLVSKAALRTFWRYLQNQRDSPEAGGILLGRMILGTDDVVIDHAAPPDPGDIRGRYHFVRKRKAAQARITRIWSETEGAVNYLGEWHTHPEDAPTPSPQDRKNWRNVHKKSSFEQDFLLFIIVGMKQIGMWELFDDVVAHCVAEDGDEASLDFDLSAKAAGERVKRVPTARR